MTTAVYSLYAAFNVKPVVVYVDLHADARPSEDGPHSGTWCSEIFESGWAQGAYCVGLNPLSNTQPTIDNLDRHAVVYKPFTWDRIKAGEVSLAQAAETIANELKHRVWYNDHPEGTSNGHPEGASNDHPGGEFPPVVLSICGDSVQGLPASAGTEMVGYSADEIYGFIAGVCSRVPVACMTVAEAKTSLEPHKAPSVGEFLTQSLFLYHMSQKNIRVGG